MECIICKNEIEETSDVCWQCGNKQQKLEAQKLIKTRTRNLITWAVIVTIITAVVVIYLNSDKRQIQGAWIVFHEASHTEEVIVFLDDMFASTTWQDNVETNNRGTFTLENGRIIIVYKSYEVVEDPDNKAMQLQLNTPFVYEYEVSRNILVINGLAYVRLTEESEAKWGS